MEIKNLNQLKKALVQGARFEIIEHMRADEIGRLREVTVVNTVGIYSIDANDPNAVINQHNDGKGTFMPLRKATSWSFEDGLCSLYRRKTQHSAEKLCVSFRMVA